MIEHQRPVAPESVTGRVAAIVAALAAQPRQSLTEVARAVGLPLSTTRRLLYGLVDGMLVDRTVEGRYQLGLVGLHAWAGPASVYGHITAVVADLAVVTGRHVRFGVWHERGVSCLGWTGPSATKSVGGDVLPGYATAMGTVLLAAGPSEACSARSAPARSHGAALARRELHAGQWGIAAPIFGPSGVVAALEIVGRRYLPDLESFTPALVYAARALGRQLCDHPALLPSGDGPTPLRWTVDPTRLIGRNGGGTPADGPSADALAARQLMSVPGRRRVGGAAAVEPRSRPHGSRHEERSTWQT